jgi:transcriptional regulator with XRE-family HTH domain
MTNDDASVYRKRRGHWLRVARNRAGLTLKEVAHAMDYSQRSASTFGLWEEGLRDPSDVQLRRLASVLGVPAEVFTEPDETDEERLERRVHAIAAAQERRDRQVS